MSETKSGWIKQTYPMGSRKCHAMLTRRCWKSRFKEDVMLKVEVEEGGHPNNAATIYFGVRQDTARPIEGAFTCSADQLLELADFLKEQATALLNNPAHAKPTTHA